VIVPAGTSVSANVPEKFDVGVTYDFAANVNHMRTYTLSLRP
jgi:hypothetical protein